MNQTQTYTLALEYLRQIFPALPHKATFHQTVASGVVLLYLLNKLRFPDLFKERRYELGDRGFVVLHAKTHHKRHSTSRDEFLAYFERETLASPLFQVNCAAFTYAFCENLCYFFDYCVLVDLPKQLIAQPLDVVDGNMHTLNNLAMLLRLLRDDFARQEPLKPITPNCSAHPVDELAAYSEALCCFHVQAGVLCKSEEIERRVLMLLVGRPDEGSIKFCLEYCNIELAVAPFDEQETLICAFDYAAQDSLRYLTKRLARVACRYYKNAIFVGVNAKNRAANMELETVQQAIAPLEREFLHIALFNVDLSTGFGVVRLLSGLEAFVQRK